jgi:hypothetical protein
LTRRAAAGRRALARVRRNDSARVLARLDRSGIPSYRLPALKALHDGSGFVCARFDARHGRQASLTAMALALSAH